MLPTPQSGFKKSTTKNNIPSEILGDWIEGSLYFSEDRVSKSAIVDILAENLICSDQDIGHTIASDGLFEITERRRITENFDQLEIDVNGVSFDSEWREYPVEAFFLLLSIFDFYKDFPGDARNLNEQGDIFEQVVTAILKNLLPGWIVLKVGWSASNPVSVKTVAADLAERLNTKGDDDPEYWLSSHAKDGGLDVVCYKYFDDGKEAMPVIFVQCASGDNWTDKVHTPSPNLWQMLLRSAVRPATALAAPFVIDGKRQRLSSVEGQVIILDRLRLLNGYQLDMSCIDAALRTRIITWMEPIIARLNALDS